MSTPASVDDFFQSATQWPAELKKLRTLLLAAKLTEELKWRQPCYSVEDNNVAILGELKDSCVLSFFKGALLNDPDGLLEKPGANTQSARVMKFTNVKQITQHAAAIKSFLAQAIDLEESGQKFEFKSEAEPIPAELQQQFDAQPAFEKAFDALTPGRQRAYLLFFNGAKQSATRSARIQKYIAQIMCGKGINDCTCGLSKKMPGCDGSHKQL